MPASANKSDLKRPHINKISNSSLLGKAILNGQTHKLLVDTGSSTTLLSTSTV